MAHIQGFPPIAASGVHTLILGSMPGRDSLRVQRYYAHSRNAFWPVLTDLLQVESLEYQQRVNQVAASGIAIWDVLKTCFRSSSLDSDIVTSSIVSNDFDGFYQNYPTIRRVFFNGAKAEDVYRRHVLPTLPEPFNSLPLQRLPSTSPAHASITVEQKKQAWRAIL